MNNYDNEIPKHIKKKESHISKAKKKAKHKHRYAECLIRYRWDDREDMRTSLKTYCTICGKINNREKNSIVTDYITKRYTSLGKCYSFLSDDELYSRYHDKMPVFYLNSIYDNYVNL